VSGEREAPHSERRTSAVELLWDLVFVFAVTQVTALLYRSLTWTGLGRSMLVLALMWWAWSAFVWAVNAHDEDSPSVRATLLVGTVLVFLTGVAIPHAFGSEAVLFAATYAGVRLLHLGLYVDASRRGSASLAAIAGFSGTVALGLAMLLAGSFLSGWPRDALWAGAVAIDYAGPGLLARQRLRSLQEVAVSHFAERYGLFILICLGESVFAAGAGASASSLSAATVAAAAAAIVITLGMWWAYFDRYARIAELRLREHPEPVLAASDAYSYLHLPLVAGIIVFAAGVRVAIGNPDSALGDAARLALAGGLALYLASHAAFLARLLGVINRPRIAGAGAMCLLYALGGGLAAWSFAALASALLAGTMALEAIGAPARDLSPAGSPARLAPRD
jgi:low temperature requirement protein LtrA